MLRQAVRSFSASAAPSFTLRSSKPLVASASSSSSAAASGAASSLPRDYTYGGITKEIPDANPKENPLIEYTYSEDERIQWDWYEWACAKNSLVLTASLLFFIGFGRNEYQKAVAHFEHADTSRPNYDHFLNRSEGQAAKWWPGRHCQFFEFNCFSKIYKEGDRLLAEKRGEETHH